MQATVLCAAAERNSPGILRRMSLTKKQRAFVQEYVQNPGTTHAEAARRAGASPKRAKITAYEWLRNPDVKREIDRQLNGKLQHIEVQARSEKLTPDSVIRDLDDIAEMCKEAGPGA